MSHRSKSFDAHAAPDHERIVRIADAVASAARAALWDAISNTTAADRLTEMRVYRRLEWPRELTTAARWARHHGASWQQIGVAAGIDADTARLRFAIPKTWRGERHLPQEPDWSADAAGQPSVSADR